MLFSKHLSEKLRIVAKNKILTFACVVMAGVSVMNHFDLKEARTYQRTIIIPMKVTDKMNFQGNDADDSYYRQMAAHVAALAFTYSPVSARSNFNDILGAYDPELYDKGKKELSILLEKIEVARICSVFYPYRYVIDRKAETIELSGLRRLIAEDGSMPENMQKTYIISYHLADGKFLLRGIDEKAPSQGGVQQAFKPLK